MTNLLFYVEFSVGIRVIQFSNTKQTSSGPSEGFAYPNSNCNEACYWRKGLKL